VIAAGWERDGFAFLNVGLPILLFAIIGLCLISPATGWFALPLFGAIIGGGATFIGGFLWLMARP
jgi:hypothetical protein